jgi:hypothetical protein
MLKEGLQTVALAMRIHSGLKLALSGAGCSAFECKQNRTSGVDQRHCSVISFITPLGHVL